MELKFADQTVELMKAVISWPLVALLLVSLLMVLYLKALHTLISSLGGRANKLSFYGLSVELASKQAVTSVPIDPRLSTLQQPDAPYIDSDAFYDLVLALQGTKDLRYIQIDVSPRQWLTSRLYLFAALLPLLTKLSRLIFTDSSHGIPNQFIAQGDPQDVARELERRYHWLRPGLDSAIGMQQQPPVVLTAGPPWTPLMLSAAAREFVKNLRLCAPGDSECTEIRPGTYEKAQWISTQNVAVILRNSLVSGYVKDDASIPPAEFSKRILSLKLPLVPLVDSQDRFKGLLIRESILESLADQALKSD
jgi:hypothetical protein